MLSELKKNSLSVQILRELSYKSKMERSLVNSLRKFDKETLFQEVSENDKILSGSRYFGSGRFGLPD